MHRVHFMLLCILTLAILGGCQEESEATLGVGALCERLLAEVIDEEMLEIDPGRLGKFFPSLQPYLANDTLESTTVFLCAEAVLSHEITLIKVKNKEQINRVKLAMEEHYKTRIASFADYAPKEAERVSKRSFVEKDRWLIYTICDDPQKATEIIKAAFK